MPSAAERFGRTFVKRFVAVIVAGALMALPISVQPAAAQQPDVGSIEKSIVQLTTISRARVLVPFGPGDIRPYDVTAESTCTGFFVSDNGHIASAGHCVTQDFALRSVYLTLAIEFGDMAFVDLAYAEGWQAYGSDPGTPIDVTYYARQPQIEGAVLREQLPANLVDSIEYDKGDLSLLRVEIGVATPALAIATQSLNLGDPVTAIGFPASVANTVDASRQRASFKTGTVSQQQVNVRGAAATEVNADVSKGMSGGPAINSNLEVVGVISMLSQGETQSFNYITDTDDLRAFIARQGIDLGSSSAGQQPVNPVPGAPAVSPGPVPSASMQSDGYGLMIVVGILALLLIAGAVAFWVLRKNGKLPGTWGQAPLPTPAQPATTHLPVPTDGPTRHCSGCGTSASPDSKFCGGCGSPL